MIAFIIRRTFIGVAMLLAMSLVTFLLFFSAGDPSRSLCQRNCTPQKIEEISRVMGYNQPVLVQYGEFLKGLVVDREYPNDPAYREAVREKNPELITVCEAPCLGFSNSEQRTVNAAIAEAAPVTISISIVAFVLWIFFGVLLGVVAAVFKGRWLDRGLVAVTLVIYAMPVFFVGTFLLNFVSLKWQLVPYPAYTPFTENPVQWLTGLLLPAVTLALFYMAAYVRITRAFVLESMSEDYIRTANAKGLAPRKVLFKHGLRAALTPLVSMAGLDFAALLAGAIITESVFTFRGLGLLAVQAQTNVDLPILMGVVLVGGVAVIVMNIVVDILYAFIDPRVRVA